MKSTNCKKPVLVKGNLFYDDMTPVKNAIVLLEIVLLEYEKIHMKDNSSLYCAYDITNDFGEFCFQINDRDHYYKIKICENYNVNCMINETIYTDR
ncbi:hypothetical protein [Clostridium taeniosporum]|uniref:Uncharacterized protein n=1 Tax=Clostridium taeniosporum TaxID=394958 RepID=A0A1D7XJA2_9CLOT|nr:hypothetical protein [Clostridium taeniosporum]AOR23414.1 hypothetical protein BGI42_06540 [Clostridium taeniosporum]